MHVIGILGGIASGKSLVAEEFERLGAEVLDADRAGHEVLTLPETISDAVERWGRGVLDAAGQIDRHKLAKIVFGDGEAAAGERRYLESITHPRIRQRLEERRQELARQGCPAVVLDAPLLLESGWDRLCDTLLFVEAPRERRRAWAESRGWSDRQLASREAAQACLDVKREAADVVIDNSGGMEQTRRQVQHLWQSLLERG